MTFTRKLVPPVIAIVLLSAYVLFLYAPAPRSCSFYSMGGILTEIKTYGAGKKTHDAACAQIRVFFENIENEISNYRENSFLSNANRQKDKRAITLPEHTYRMIKESLRISEITLGYFDITVLPVLDLWKKAQKENKVPSAEELEAALKKVSYKKLALDDIGNPSPRLFFKVPGMELDLGAVAKGYMGDESRKIMERLGIQRGLINCGGGIVVFDNRENPEDFTIKIYNPDKGVSAKPSPDNFGISSITMANGSIQTSGDYNRFYTINGKRYSHIVDPHTGLPSGNCHSITVKSTARVYSGAIADAYATAFCAMIAAGIPVSKLPVDEVEILQLKK